MPIGSHIIPKFYMGRFANLPDRKNGKPHLWVYEKGAEPAYRATSAQGAENGYFAYVNGDGTLDESLEKRLERLEESCLDTLVLTATRFFDIHSASRRNALALYASMLFCRAKQRRNRAQITYAHLQTQFSELSNDNEWIIETTSRFNEQHQEQIPPELLKGKIAQLAVIMDGKTALRNNFVEDLVLATEAMKNVLLQKPWQLWNAPEGIEYVTSDNPLISFIPLPNGGLNPGHGLRKPETVAVLPIAPHICLAMGVEGLDLVTIGPSLVENINRTIIELSERYVYSKTRSRVIQQLVNQFASTRRYGVNAFLPIGTNLPTAKNFVLHMLRLAPWPFPAWLTSDT